VTPAVGRAWSLVAAAPRSGVNGEIHVTAPWLGVHGFGVGNIPTSVNVPFATLTVNVLDGLPSALGVAVSLSKPGGTSMKLTTPFDMVSVASLPA